MKRLLTIVLALASLQTSAQIGGDNVFEFVNISPSARATALGGRLLTVMDDDVNLAYFNPAVANDSMHMQVSFNHGFHLAGISNSYVAYGHHLDKWDVTLHGGIHSVNYGEFDMTDVFANTQGTFEAKDIAINVGAAKQLYKRLSVGVNLKYITSQLETYTSNGIAADLGALYHNDEKQFTMGLVAKNIGTQLSTYTPDNKEPFPYDMQVAISKRLPHLPFRFSFIYHNLNRWNLTYDDPNSQEDVIFFTEEQPTENRTAILIDNFARHLIVNGEFLFGAKENFRLRAGYNHLMHQELTVKNFRSLAGFSFGVGLKIYKFKIDYGRQIYHLGGAVNHLAISTNINSFLKNGIVD